MPAPAPGRAPLKDKAVDKTSKSIQPSKAPAASSSSSSKQPARDEIKAASSSFSSKQPAPSSTSSSSPPARGELAAPSSSSSAKLPARGKPTAATSTSSSSRSLGPTKAQMLAYMESYAQLKEDGKLKHVWREDSEDDPFGDAGPLSESWPPEGAWGEEFDPLPPLDEGDLPACPIRTSVTSRPGRLDSPDTDLTSPSSGPGKTLARDDSLQKPRQRLVASDASSSTSAPPSTVQIAREQPRGPPATSAERSQPSRINTDRENTDREKSGSSQNTGKAAQGKQRR